MKYKSAFFLGAVSAKLDFLREDLINYCSGEQWVTPAAYDDLMHSVDTIRGLVEKIFYVERNAEEEIDSNGENRTV